MSISLNSALVFRVKNGLLFYATEEQIRKQLLSECVSPEETEAAIQEGKRLYDLDKESRASIQEDLTECEGCGAEVLGASMCDTCGEHFHKECGEDCPVICSHCREHHFSPWNEQCPNSSP